jgi:hypothetical protein
MLSDRIHTLLERVTALQPTRDDVDIPVVRTAARPTELSVESIKARIDALSRKRQELRVADAPERELERNRLQIVAAQWELSHALVRRYLPGF